MAVIVAIRELIKEVRVADAAVVELVGRFAVNEDRRAAEALVAAVVDGEELAGLGENQVVGVSQTRRVDAQRRVGRQDCLVQAVIAAERSADIDTGGGLVARSSIVGDGRIVERRQVVFIGAGDAGRVDENLAGNRLERDEVDLEHGSGQRIFRRIGEKLRRRAVVGVAALRQVELGAVGAQHHAVGRMVLFRARQAADQVDLAPAGAVPRQLGKNSGVGVEVEIEVADARIARGDVDYGVVGGSRDQDAGDLTIGDRGVQRPVIVVIGYVVDEAQRLRLDRRPLTGHRRWVTS